MKAIASNDNLIRDDDDLKLNTNLSFDLKSSTYSSETEIFSYINSLFKSIDNSLVDYNYLIQVANNYLSTNNEISSYSIQDIDNGLNIMDINNNNDENMSLYNSSSSDNTYTDNNYSNKEYEFGVVKISSGKLNVRSSASSNSEVVDKLKKGEIVNIVERGDKWTKISYLVEGDKTEGYVLNKYLEVKNNNNENVVSNVTPVNSDDTSTIPTPSDIQPIQDDSISETALNDDHIANNIKTYENMGTISTNGGRLNVRTDPSTSSKVITRLENGDVVDVVERGDKWSKVSFLVEGDKTEGYVSNDYLKMAIGNNNLNPTLPTNNNQTTNYVTGTVKTQGGRLNIRSGQGTNTKILDRLNNNSKIQIVEPGDKWTKISYMSNGKEKFGYVSNSFIEY